ncbi:hypothetical protein [Cupriavidus taiwanensis]|nr:hypothetical protein [Cupriavidus taiwanensis]
MQALLAKLKEEGTWTLQTGVHALMAEWRHIVLRNQGVLRATLLQTHSTAGPRFSSLKTRRRYRLPMQLHGGGDRALRERRLRVAFQFAFGSIINGLLNNPGPLRLTNCEFDGELAWAFCACLHA